MKAFSWFGGKGKIAKFLLGMVPDGIKLYCEPYCGSAALLFSRQRTCREVLNDIDIWLVNFYRVVQGDRYGELRRKLGCTPYAFEEYLRAWHIVHDGLSDDEVDRAWAFFVIQNQGFAGHPAVVAHRRSWSRSLRGFIGNTALWACRVNWLDACRDRIRLVTVNSMDAHDCIRMFDGRDTFFYIDPPYPPDTVKDKKSYYQNPDIEHFITLRNILVNSSAAIMLSSYDSFVWKELRNYGWESVTKRVCCHTVVWNGKVDSDRTEVVWRNPRCLEMFYRSGKVVHQLGMF